MEYKAEEEMSECGNKEQCIINQNNFNLSFEIILILIIAFLDNDMAKERMNAFCHPWGINVSANAYVKL